MDNPDRDYILNGVANGFRITDIGRKFKPAEHRNYKPVTRTYRDLVRAQIYLELEAGNYRRADHEPTIISSLGAVPKPKSSAIRLVHDYSRPLSLGLNSYATVESLKYRSIDDAAKLLPRNGYRSKVDLKSAYRSVRIHKDCQEATGLL